MSMEAKWTPLERELIDLAYQYRSDLLHPPSDDSRQRRIERIDAVLSRAQAHDRHTADSAEVA